MEFDWFIDTVPEVIERVEQAKKVGQAEGEAKGKVEGKLEGELQALRLIVLDTVQDRFPDLMDFAQSQAPLIKQPALLRKLIRDLQHAPDETTVIKAFKTAKQGA